jgi:hypothetical protein
LVAFTEPLHQMVEFFGLRRAERVIRARSPAAHERVRDHFVAAERRLAAGRRALDDVAASLLMCAAVRHYLAAMSAAGTPEVTLPDLPRDAARPDASPADADAARAALASDDALYFDRLGPAEADRTRRALERAASVLRRRVEARTLVHVRGSRWGRIAAIFVVLAYAGLLVARAKLLPKDIALGKPITLSSNRGPTRDGHELVDGDVGLSYAVATNNEESPSATVDLQRPYRIKTVKVYNRVDGWYDDCLPLVVEASVDGAQYVEIARRDAHFGWSPPWVVDGRGTVGRFVRLRVARRSYLALSEVEVFGDPE